MAVLLVAGWTLGAAAPRAAAAQTAIDLTHLGERKLLFQGSLDYFTPDGAGRGMHPTLTPTHQGYQQLGYGSVRSSVRARGGYGVRIGGLYQLERGGLQVGGGLGYLVGPEVVGAVDAADPVLPPQVYELTTKTQFIRVLVEVQKEFELSERADLFLNVGAGAARGQAEVKDNAPPVEHGDAQSGSVTRIGFTWEVSAGAAITLRKTTLIFGLRYAAFPTLVVKSGAPTEVAWYPSGLFLGLRF